MNQPPNGTHFPAMQFQVATPQPGIQALTFAHGQVAAQVQLTLADADRFCAAWRKAIDEAKSGIQVVSPSLIVKP